MALISSVASSACILASVKSISDAKESVDVPTLKS
jgi:hypothetical protein